LHVWHTHDKSECANFIYVHYLQWLDRSVDTFVAMNMVLLMARPDQLATPDGSVASKLVWDYFDRAPSGVFVDVGAGYPVNGNQTWFLEQQGWRGVLIEPHPAMAALLREKRPDSRTFQMAAGRPEQVGWTDFYLGQNRSSPR